MHTTTGPCVQVRSTRTSTPIPRGLYLRPHGVSAGVLTTLDDVHLHHVERTLAGHACTSRPEKSISSILLEGMGMCHSMRPGDHVRFEPRDLSHIKSPVQAAQYAHRIKHYDATIGQFKWENEIYVLGPDGYYTLSSSHGLHRDAE